MKIPAGQSLILDKDTTYNEVLEVEGVLILDSKSNVTLTTSNNIIVTGNLISQPDPSVVHTIRFMSIDENKFIGGGDAVLDSDIGMWVTGAGQLNLNGVVRGDWKQLTVEPTTLESFAKEVTSNLRIEGTATGQSHLFIKSSRPQTIRYVQFRYLGPRKDTTGDGIKEVVLGRYAVHLHHAGEGSRGSIIEGCIVRDCNSHAFVPHGSNGITMRNNIVYNVLEAPFWWDYGHMTNDLTWENNLVVNVGYVPRANDADTGGPSGGVNGFVLGFGDGNVCRGNVVVGTSGDYRAAGAYNWPEIRDDNDTSKDLTSSWTFEDNVAINCPSGDQVWQNSEHHHVILRSIYINCQVPVYHGAYANDYLRKDCIYKGGTVEVWAASNTTRRILFINCTFDAQGADNCVVINEGPGVGAAPVTFRGCKFINFKEKAILNQNPGPALKTVDVIDCVLNPSQVEVSKAAKSGEWIRIQDVESAWKVTKSGSTPIAKFAPSNWGTGTGLKAEYYAANDFKTLLLTRIEPNVNLFDLTHPSPHYLVPASFAARWTGKIQPQFTEAYKFICKAGGGIRLWVNNIQLINNWVEHYPGETTSYIINLTAGLLYDLKLEFFNTDERSGCTLEWSSPSLKREFVPMSQLYPGDVTPPPPPINKAPIADAGIDETFNPQFTLSGSGNDPEGGLVTFKWEQVSGPPCVIVNPAKAITAVKRSDLGVYVFKLTVTDDKGATATDTVTKIIQ